MKQLKGLIAFFAFVSVFAACKKEYSREKDNGANTLSQWEFKEGATQYNGSVDTAFVDTTGGIQFLTIEGTSLDRSKKISLGVFSQDLKAGTYSSPTAFIDFLDNGAVVYESDITAIGQFTIVISKIDSIGVSGTFSGKVKDSNGNPKDVV
ncbi:MAG: hypothetical protein H7Y27_10425, partial [Gemmatimonadaceae bacterium]|nr:hypothetical protein [Chitinophagaceae bacterium]